MSVRIAFDDQPEFYTNLDFITGRIILGLNRAEQIGSIVVKLEGESITAVEYDDDPNNTVPRPVGGLSSENHKVLYKFQQVFPDDYHASSSNPYGSFPMQPGEHTFPFKFKVPINNGCGDQAAMSRLGGIAGSGGFGTGPGLFGFGGVRVMDGTKQLGLRHVTHTLPPSLTGYPMEAEIRYYVKVTVQRPGLLKENWRSRVGFKFLPIEPPRPNPSGQEAFARRPFTFQPRSPSQQLEKKSSIFTNPFERARGSIAGVNGLDGGEIAPAPSLEISARLPHPPVLTCNQPVPLRLIAKKLNNNPEPVYLASFQMDLVGITELRAHGLGRNKVNRWVIVSSPNLNVLLPSSSQDELGKEVMVPKSLWETSPLPNTVAPSFSTCNITRRYALELRIGLRWGKSGPLRQAPTIFLPLHFAKVEVHSGITPPDELLQAVRKTRASGGRGSNATLVQAAASSSSTGGRPNLPPRTGRSGSTAIPLAPVQPPIMDPLYPPQLVPGQETAPYDDAPPSYDEAMAENLTGPGSQSRPAYSGVTNENAPSQMPVDEKSRGG